VDLRPMFHLSAGFEAFASVWRKVLHGFFNHDARKFASCLMLLIFFGMIWNINFLGFSSKSLCEFSHG
jgi:hypothetical protein